MSDTGKTKIVIGAETEYGILGHSEKRGYIIHSHLLATEVVHSITRLYHVFLRTLGGIKNKKEHTIMERILGRKIRDLLMENISGGVAQRYGLSGVVPMNGSRFYVDCDHPEYSIPETSNPRDALIAQKAGDFIVNECRKYAEEALRRDDRDCIARYLGHPTLWIRMDRTNSDAKGASYAGHENYSVSPEIFKRVVGEDRYFFSEGDLSQALMIFLAARQVICGAGKVGYESGKPIPFQISARADFIEREISFNTIARRPIINTRDHPYADENIVRRLHVICGDSNMSQLSLFLKFGLTALFLMMLEDGFLEREESVFGEAMVDPVLSYKNISRDLTLEHKIFFKSGLKKTALEIMAEMSELIDKFVSEKGLPEVWADVSTKLKGTVNGLWSNRHQDEFSRNLDWAAKERILSSLMKRKSISWNHHECFMVNFRYQNIDPEESIFYRIEKRGEIIKIAEDDEIQNAVLLPPKDTRASVRGYLVAKHRQDISSIGWDHVRFKDGSYADLYDPRRFDLFMPEMDYGSLAILREAVDACRRRSENA